LQARPETVQSTSDSRYTETFRLQSRDKVLTKGKSVGQKIATGKARIILDARDMHQLQPGEVLVSDITDPDWEPVMKIAAAIVTNRGGRTCHAAIVARELGVPAIVGCGNATQMIQTDQQVTVSCAEGDDGFVYEGAQEFSREQIDLNQLEKPRTHIMLNLANPAQAFEASRLPCDGVGLARLEFIINNSIRIHPRTLIEYDSQETQLRCRVDSIIAGYPSPKEFYIDRLAEGIGMIAAAFYPKKVIVRMSDFKSNEYASLIGGKQYEPKEENPMIGFRGAARYPSPEFAEAFAMECAAMKQVRETMGLDNLSLMIPFVRSIDEAQQTLDLMAKHGLKRGENGLKIYMMCEIPANALLADDFIELFDGFSIGSNDLTQLTLGVDRDSNIIKGFDERNEAVLKLMEMAIQTCKRNNKYVGICGQAPSDYPEITRWLIEQGIESISLNPDSIISMSALAKRTEDELERAR
jgi:pyruvate,water dikinase